MISFIHNKNKNKLSVKYLYLLYFLWTLFFMSAILGLSYQVAQEHNVRLLLQNYVFIIELITICTALMIVIPFFWMTKKNDLQQHGATTTSRYWEYGALLGIVLLGLILRLTQVTDIGQTVDGFLHNVNAIRLLYHLPNEYQRTEIYTYCIFFAYKTFGINNFASHFFDVVINVLMIPLTYLLTKKILQNSTIALVAAFLIAVALWHIAAIGDIRMYNFLNFFTLVLIYLVHFIFFEKQLISYNAQKITQFLQKNWYYFIILFLIAGLLFELHVVVASIAPIIFLFLMIYLLSSAIIDLHKNKISYRTFNLALLVGVGVITIILCIFFASDTIGSFLSGISFQKLRDPQLLALVRSKRNGLGWLCDLYGLPVIIVSLITFAIYSIKKKRWDLFFLWFLFVGSWFESIFLFDRYFAPRYILFFLPVFIIMLSTTIFLLFKSIVNHWIRIALVTLLSLFILISFEEYLIVIHQKTGENKNFDIYYDFQSIVQSIDISPRDALIESTFGPFYIYQDKSNHIIDISRLQNDGIGQLMPTEKTEENFFSTINTYSHGWFLTDVYRFQKWSCEEYTSCTIRNFVNSHPMFRLHPYPQDPQLLLFEWNKNWTTEQPTAQYAPSNQQ